MAKFSSNDLVFSNKFFKLIKIKVKKIFQRNKKKYYFIVFVSIITVYKEEKQEEEEEEGNYSFETKIYIQIKFRKQSKI